MGCAAGGTYSFLLIGRRPSAGHYAGNRGPGSPDIDRGWGGGGRNAARLYPVTGLRCRERRYKPSTGVRVDENYPIKEQCQLGYLPDGEGADARAGICATIV